MKLSLKERFGPRVQVKAIDRVPSGSPARVSVAISSPNPNTPGAAIALAKRHMPMGQAHRLMTRLVQGEPDLVTEVPMVEDIAHLIAELAGCGIEASAAEPPATLDVRAVREKSGLSQEQFALAYGLDVATVRNWEQGRTSPDLTARNYLTMIATDPAGMRHRRLESVRKFTHDNYLSPAAE